MANPASPRWLRWRTGLWLGCWLALMTVSLGCTQPNSAEGTPDLNPATPPTQSSTENAENPGTAVSQLGQQLPITAKTVLGGEEIFLEVAETPAQQALGLMYRDALPDDRGMVFPMNRPRPVRFWMMNVPVALDMVFIYQGTIQYIAAEVPPCTMAPCPTYGPDSQLVDHVIELRAGRAEELGLQVGDTVEILPLE